MKTVLKKAFLLVGAVIVLTQGALFAVDLTAKQQAAVGPAAIVLTQVMNKYNISVQTLVTAIDTFREQYAEDEQKLAFIDAIQDATLDAYYGVENFAACTSYYDGCNTCAKGQDEYDLACTKMACFHMEEPSCLSYEPIPYVEEDLGVICENAGGTWLAEFDECEGMTQDTCVDYGGTYEMCGSACRHDTDAVVCTLQCVSYCEFGENEAHIQTQADLDAAVALWESWETDDYEVEQKRVCFCPVEYVRPIGFQVADGVVNEESAMYIDEEGGVLSEMAPALLTVEEMFALIQEAIDDNAQVITVEYDESMGFPMSLYIDQSYMIADEEMSYTYNVIVG